MRCWVRWRLNGEERLEGGAVDRPFRNPQEAAALRDWLAGSAWAVIPPQFYWPPAWFGADPHAEIVAATEPPRQKPADRQPEAARWGPGGKRRKKTG